MWQISHFKVKDGHNFLLTYQEENKTGCKIKLNIMNFCETMNKYIFDRRSSLNICEDHAFFTHYD